MGITFVHTSDWQLGKQFSNISGDAGAALREQRIETVKTVAKLAQERNVDAIVVSGDVFETNAVADRTLFQVIDAVKQFEGDWVFIPGNHDPALADSVWKRIIHKGKPDNAHFLLKEGEPLMLNNGAVAILAAVLERRHEVDDLTASFNQIKTPEGTIRIGLAHGSVTEFLPDTSGAPNPIAANRAEAACLDYLALGDWHGTLEINERTWYAGTPEPDRFGSSDPGNVLVVTINRAGESPLVEKVPVGRYVWRQSEYNIYTAADIVGLEQHLEALDPNPERILVWLKLAGVISLTVREQLNEKLEEWEARLRYLRLDNQELIAQPNDDDLDCIGRTGFVRTAVERLRAQADDQGNPEREIAEAALIRLYQENVRVE